MIEEDFISFETAKLLKEKGFHEPANSCYTYIGSVAYTSYYDWNLTTGKYADYSRVQLWVAMKWLEEVHHILVIPDYIYECTDTSWVYKIYRLGENGKPERNEIIGASYDSNGNTTQHTVGYRDYDISKQEYATRTDAVEEGIKYCLENLI